MISILFGCLALCLANDASFKSFSAIRSTGQLASDNHYVKTSIINILAIRGGADEKVKSDIVSSIGLKIIKLLKIIIPRAYWLKSWKSKNSKMMSKEHLEKSFAKGDSSSRVQKVLRFHLLLKELCVTLFYYFP